MKTCPTGKRAYPSLTIAEDALIEAWSRYNYGNGSGPVAVYLCDQCGSYHFTSRGPMNEALSREIAAGKIRLQKEANQWTDKLKK